MDQRSNSGYHTMQGGSGVNSLKSCISWHLIIILKTFFEQWVFKIAIFSQLPMHISNSNFHWLLITGAYLQNGKSGKI
jgi:hypothetical protein